MSSATLLTSDGIGLASRAWPAPQARAAVVLVHGFAASKDEAAVVAMADALSARDLYVLSYDGRGHGASGGACTLGDLERHDVAAAVARAREDWEHVVLLGASMGGIAALRHAATDPDLAGVVTVSSPAAWRLPRTGRALLAAGFTQTSLGRMLAARLMRVRLNGAFSRPTPPRDLAAKLSVPYAVVHGRADRFIPVRDAEELYAHAVRAPRRTLELVPGMGHAFDAAGLETICRAVDWTLGA